MRPRRLSSLLCAVLVAAACAQLPVTELERQSMRRIVVVAGKFQPEADLEAITSGRLEGAARGGVVDALTALQLAATGECSGGETVGAAFCGAVLVVGAAVLATSALVGAVAGVVAADPGSEVGSAEEVLATGVSHLQLTTTPSGSANRIPCGATSTSPMPTTSASSRR